MYFDDTLFSTTNTLQDTAESSQTMYLFAGHVEWNAIINFSMNITPTAGKVTTALTDFLTYGEVSTTTPTLIIIR